MNEADNALLLLAASIFFALIIERLVEVIKNVYKLIDVRAGLEGYWNCRAIRIRDRLLERIDGQGEKSLGDYLALRYLDLAFPHYEGARVISAKSIRTGTIRSACKAVGVILGVVIALALEIDVFALVGKLASTDGAAATVTIVPVSMPTWLGCTLTGIAMGLGAGPIHKLIEALEAARGLRQPIDKG